MNIKVVVNVLYNNVFILSGLLFPVITFPYVTRVLGPESLGVVNLGLSISTIFVMLMQLGMPIYGIKAMAKCDDIDEKRKVFWSLITINFFAGLLSSAGYCAFVYLLGYYSSEPLLFVIILPSIFFGFTSVDWYFASNEDFKSIAIRTLVLRIISLVCLFSFVTESGDYNIYAFIIIIGNLLANGFMFIIACNQLGSYFLKLEFLEFKKHIRPLKYLFYASVVAALYGSFDILVIEYFWGAEFVGYYSVDRRLTLIIIALIGSFSTVLIPKMTRYITCGNDEGFNSLFLKSFQLLYLINIPLIVTLFLFSDEIIHVFAGASFTASALVLQILSFQVLFNSASNLLNIQVLIPLNKERVVFNSSALGLVVSVLLCVILIPRYDIVGAAVALVISELTVFALRIKTVSKITGIKLFNKIFLAISGCGVGLYLSLFFSKIFIDSMITGFSTTLCFIISAVTIASTFFFILSYYITFKWKVDVDI